MVCHTPGVSSRRGLVGAAVAALLLLSGCGNPSKQPDAVPRKPPRLARTFDLAMHLGAAAPTKPGMLATFGQALDMGVTSLEFPTQVTTDGRVLVGTDPNASAAAAPTLDDVIALVRARQARSVSLIVELAFRADEPRPDVSRERFARAVWSVIDHSGMAGRVSVESLDWGTLAQLHRIAPGVRLIAKASPQQLERGMPGASPWLDGIDIDQTSGGLVAAALHIPGVVAVSPSEDLVQVTVVRQAHRDGLYVIPWTVDDAPTMKRLVKLGVDGIVTNRPDLLRSVMSDTYIPMPQPYPATG